MIAVWHGGGEPLRTLMARFDLRPVGTEVPEVLMGLCLCLYTYGNLRRLRARTGHLVTNDGGRPEQSADVALQGSAERRDSLRQRRH